MADERQTKGEALGLAARSIKRRLINAFLAARQDPNAKLTPAEVVTVALKMWQGIAAGLVPTSPDGSVIIGTAKDANGDDQLTLQAAKATQPLPVPFAVYQFWRGAGYGTKDASGNQLDLTVEGGSETYSDCLSYGSGFEFSSGRYLASADTSGKFQTLGEISAVLAFQITSLPASGKWACLFTIDGVGSGAANCLFLLSLLPSGKLALATEYTDGHVERYTADPVLEAGKLYHVVVARNSGAHHIYLNGTLIGSATFTALERGEASVLNIGAYFNDLTNSPFLGKIASFAFYAKELAAYEAAMLYHEDFLRWGTRPGGGSGAPAAHASSHVTGGSDVITNAVASGNAGLMSGADKAKLDGVAAGATVGADWNTNVTNKPTALAPTAHASTHAAGQPDALSVTEGMLSLADNTTADASTTKHGLLSKLPNDTNKILHGDGVWAALAEAGLNLTDLTTGNLSTSRHGFAPKAPNDATKYLDGTGAWSVPYTSGFTTAYEVDFSGLPSQNVLTGGDGAKTIDGKAWTLANSNGLQTAYVNDGSHAGLYLRGSTLNVNNTGGTLSAGALYAALSALNATLAQYHQFREVLIWVNYSMPHLPNANYEMFQAAVFAGTPYTAAGINRMSIMSYYADGNGYGHTHLCLSGVDTTAGGTGSSRDCFVFRLIDGVISETYHGNMVAGAWPAKTALTRSMRAIFGTTGTITRDNWYLSFSIITGNTAGNADGLIKKLKIEYK